MEIMDTSALAGIIVPTVYVFRIAFPEVPQRFIPLVSFLIGVLIGGADYLIRGNTASLHAGLLAGLVASGAYDMVRGVVNPKE